jgi:hypothetical protein
MKVFGKVPPNAPPDFEPIDTPVGQLCDYCHEPIAEGDTGAIVPSTTTPDGPWMPQHAFCQAVEAYQQVRAMHERAKAWAALWKRAASRYRTQRNRWATARRLP